MSLPFLQPYFGLSNSLQTAQASAGGGGVGGWVELGRTSGSGTTNIDVTSLVNKRYYMILTSAFQTGNPDVKLQVGNGSFDTGSNYASRWSEVGGADSTQTSASNLIYDPIGATFERRFGVGYVANKSDKEKLFINHNVASDGTSAGVSPRRAEMVGKWANTASVIDRIRFLSVGANFTSSDEMVVLGWDPADTHTTNFWTELYSGDLSAGAATNIDSGTITAKKYLWVQLYTQQSVDSDYLVTFNGDNAGTTYARRYMHDGVTEITGVSQANFTLVSRPANLPQFTNMFIINNSANEKLVIAHQVNQMTAGAGTAPTRTEYVGKWANTSAQITSINVKSGSGNLATKTILKVWGSD